MDRPPRQLARSMPVQQRAGAVAAGARMRVRQTAMMVNWGHRSLEHFHMIRLDRGRNGLRPNFAATAEPN
jgi:hypothetical protein